MSLKIVPQIFGNKNRPVIFFLHGFMGEISDFDFFYKALGQDYCCVGISYPLVSTNFDEYIENLKKIVLEFKTPRFILGYSMGGRIALGLSSKYPELFQKQIILSAHPGLLDKNEKLDREQADQRIFRDIINESSWRAFLGQWYQQSLFGNISHDPNFHQLIKKDFSLLARYQQQINNFSLGLQDNYWHQKTLTHYIAGALDQKYLKIGKQFIEANPHHLMSIIPMAGHKCYFEGPAILRNIIKQTLT